MAYWERPYDRVEPGLTWTWIDRVPLFIIPVVIVFGVLLYGGVIPGGAGQRRRRASSLFDRRIGEGAAPAEELLALTVGLIMWTALWLLVALLVAVMSESPNSNTEPVRMSEPGGLLFAAALL